MGKLKFKPIALENREEIEVLLKQWGSVSCQYSFPGLWCLREKYGTEFCVEKQTLYLRQKLRKTEEFTTYFPPVCQRMEPVFIERILEHAKDQGEIPCFFGITEERLHQVKSALPDNYILTEDRDWAEYLYRVQALLSLEGSSLSEKRRDVRAFWRRFGSQVSVEPIHSGNVCEALRFQNHWQEDHAERNGDKIQLLGEHLSILSGLAHYEELGLSGILIKIYGRVAAYSYGTWLEKSTYDVIAQKADHTYKNITPVLFTELVRHCCPNADYVNYEEDIGLAGLRRAKLSYRPELLLKKYRALPARTGDKAGERGPYE